MIEKPIANSSQEACELVEKAENMGVPVLVGHHRRYNPIIQKAKNIIGSGEIGIVRAVHANCWFYKSDEYFNVAPWRKKAGAGPISVNLAHDIDLLRHFCGEIETVQAQAVDSIRGFQNEDVAGALLKFRDGAIGTISVSDSIVSPWSWEMTSKENPIYPSTQESCYLIGGSHGSLSIPDLNLWSHKSERDWWKPLSSSTKDFKPADPLYKQINHFINVIKKEEKPIVSGREGLLTLRVIEAIQKSALTQKSVKVEV
jgi:predicted dehydrogenase